MNILCQKCKENLSEYGAPYQELYEEILFLNSQEINIFIDEFKCKSYLRTLVKYLESKSLIITTETSKNKILVKVNHKILFYNEEFDKFCFNIDNSHFLKKSKRKKMI